jgi:hypothetical protein
VAVAAKAGFEIRVLLRATVAAVAVNSKARQERRDIFVFFIFVNAPE